MMRIRNAFPTVVVGMYVVLAYATTTVEGQVIHDISPNRGSIAGGTRVTITGRGFQNNGPDGFEATGENFFTTVFFGNNICEIEDYYTNQNQIVCYAPPLAHAQDEDSGNVIVSVQTIGVGFASFADCKTWCRFRHRWHDTPVVNQHTLGGYAGTLLSLDGYFRNHDVDDFSGELGGLKCNFRRGRAVHNGVSECMVMNAPVGRYNATIRVHHPHRGYGEPYYGKWASQVGLDGQPFHYTLHPHIESISHNEGGLNGDAEITIKGYGFSYNIDDNEITLGDLPCRIQTVEPPEEDELENPQTIVCLTSAVPSDYHSQPKSPGRGMSVRTYREVQKDLHWYYENDPKVHRQALQTDQFTGGWTIRHARAWHDRDQLVEGLFIPPLSRYYSWYILGRKYKALHISTDESRANLSTQPVALSNWHAFSYFDSDSQISEPLWFEAGKRYFVAALHSGDWHLDDFQVGLRIHDASEGKYHLEADQSVYELQEIDIQSNVTFEQQEIVLEGVETGTFLLSRSDRLPCKGFKIDLSDSKHDIEQKASDFVERLTARQSRNMCGDRDDADLDCGNVDATLSTLKDSRGFAGYALLLTFRCPTFSKFPLISVEYENGDPNSLVTIVNRTRSITDENRVRDPRPPVRGTFRLCLEEECTWDIDYNAGDGNVEDALESLSFVEDVEVSREGDPDFGRQYRVWFFRPYGNVTLLAADSSSLTGADVHIEVQTLQEGDSDDVFYSTVPMDWFELPPIESGSVRASVRGMLSSCNIFSENGCSWQYKSSLTPKITSVSPNTAVVGDTLTVEGEGFVADVFKNDIFIGEGRCNVTSAGEDTLTCQLQDTNEGIHVVQVFVGEGRGKATTTESATVEVDMDLFDASPLEGSLAGGTIVNVSGTGFSANETNNDVSIVLDSSGVELPAEIVHASHRLVSIRMPSVLNHTSDRISASIKVNGKQYSESFTFKEELTWRIKSVEPTQVSAATSGIVEFHLENINHGSDSPIAVHIGSRRCQQATLNVTAATLRCALIRGEPPAMPQEPVLPLIHIDLVGYADANSNTIDVGYRVDRLSMKEGSILGGQELHVFGFGFGKKTDGLEVRINLDTVHDDWVLCELQSVSNDEIVCITSSVKDLVGEQRTTDATVEVRRSRTAAVCAEGTCNFRFSNTSTPVCDGIDDSDGEPGKQLIVSGNILFDGRSTVTVGSESCSINETASTSDRLVCTLPFNRAGNHSIQIGTKYGNAFCPFEVSYSLHVESISSAAGSFHGGHWVTLEGQGFSGVSSENIVHFDDKLAEIIESGFQKLTVYTPAKDIDESEHVPQIRVAIKTGHSNSDGNEHGGHHGRMLTAMRFLEDSNGTNASPSPNVSPSRTPTSTASVTSTPSQTASATGTPTSTPSVSGSGTVTPTASVTAMASAGAVGLSLESQTSVILSNSYAYKESLTGTAESVSPKVVQRGSVLVITGNFPDRLVEGSYIRIGDEDCSIRAWNATRVECIVGNSPAGTFDVEFVVGDRGRIVVPKQVSVELSISMASTVEIGLGGGKTIEISGHGWPALNGVNADERPKNGSTRDRACGSPAPNVAVCGRECKLQTVEAGKIECIAPSLITPAALSAFGHYKPEVLTGSVFGSRGDSGSAFDGDISTEFQDHSDNCHVGLDVGVSLQGQLTEIWYYPSYRESNAMVGGVFEGSNDNENWEEIAVVGSNVVEGWNSINLDDTSDGYRYLRYVGPDSGRCDVAEVEFEGFLVSTTDECDLAVKMECSEGNEASDMLDSKVKYSVLKTPFIESITPSNGTSDGGTEVTISGSGFSGNTKDIDVHLNGVRCSVTASSTNSITCVTGKRDKIRRNSVEVLIAGTGLALHAETTVFRYLDRWSQPATWNFDNFPVFNDTVHIPRGQSVLLDQSTPVLWVLLIEGELIFDNQDLSLDANYILINGGRFEVGREDNPFYHRAVITLHGDRWESVQVPTVGAKVLSVFNVGANSGHGHGNNPAPDEIGYLDLHGKPRIRSWTFLESTASAGDDEIHTAEDVDFEPGDRLIVTSNGRNFRETEEVEVASVCGARCLKIKGEFQYAHGVEVFEAGKYGHSDVHMRSEVGLLSRNILVKGDDNSRKQVFGAHTLVAHGGYYRIENVEFSSCGQGGRLGRYCTHSHMAGDNSHSYVKSNSYHHALQRAVTIHGTHKFTTSHNVAYKVKGHTIFFEDGVEKFNPTEENLVVWTLPLTMGINSDDSPACFWMAGPTQFLRHNVAAGSVNYGFWYELPGTPHGPSSHHPIVPHNDDIGEFFNNTVHSCDVHGLRIYPIYTPMRLQKFQNLTSYRNGGQGIFGYRNGDLQHVNHKILENGALGQMWRFFPTGFREDTPNIKDCLYVGNVNGEMAPIGQQAIFGPMDDYFHVSGVTIVNYGDSGAISMCIDCEGEKQGGFTTRFERMAFYNSRKRTKWTEPKKQIFWDLDGTLTGHVNGTATPYYKFNEGSPHCMRDEEGTYDGGIVCDGEVRVRRLAIDNNYPRELNWEPFIFKQLDNTTFSDIIQYRRTAKSFNGWLAPLVTHSWYDASVDTLVDWQRFRFRYGRPEFIEMDSTVMEEYIGLKMSWIDFRWRNKVVYAPGSSEEEEVPSLEQPGQPDRMPRPQQDRIGTGWIERAPDHDNDTWHVVINDINATASGDDKYRFEVHRITCPPDNVEHPWLPDICLPPPQPEKLTVYNWTDPAAWPNGTFPKAGKDVTIDSSKHIIVNTETPIVKGVSVDGKLSFAENGVLNAKTMTIWREMEMGTPEKPLKNATIRLHGDRRDDALVVANGLNLGNKVIAVFGNVTMAGVSKTGWTRLAHTLTAGTRLLELDDSPEGWKVGDRLVITATEYDIDEQETRKIESINGKSVTLDSVVEFTHSVTADVYGNRMAAAVGNLDRSISVEGYISPEAQSSGEVGRANYGMHWVVTEVAFDDDDLEKSHFVGNVQMENVQFFQCGKQQMEHGCFRFAYPQSKALGSRNRIFHSSFAYSLNYGIVAEQHGGHMEVTGNVIHRTFRSGIDFWDGTSNGAIITDNLIAGVFRSPDQTTRWLVPTSGIFMDGLPDELSGNFISSSSDGGVTFRPDVCGDIRVTDNEVSSSLVGAFILSESGDCRIVSGFKTWKIAHVAILTVDQGANLIVDGAVVADSHIGISLNFVTGGTGNYANITNSMILGSTSLSSCGASMKCRAVSESDLEGKGCNSVFGGGYRRVGIVNSQYTGKAKTCHASPEFSCDLDPPNTPGKLCSLPWELRYGVPETFDATVNIDNVTFGDFQQDDCGLKSVAVAHNPSQIDFAPKVRMSRIRWNNVEEAAKFSFGSSMCTGKKCQGFWYILFHDVDGTMHGSAGGTLIYNNPPLSLPSPDCTAMTDWIGIWCPMKKFEPMLFAPDTRTNDALSPLLASHFNEIDFNNPEDDDRIYSAQGDFKDMCAIDKLKNWIRFAVITGEEHHVQLFNTQPAQMQFTFQSRDPNERVLIKLFLQKPNTMEIYFNGEFIEPQNTIPQISERAGSNHFNPQQRHIWIVITGDPKLARVAVIRTPDIQLNVKLRVSPTEFWEGNGQRALINNLAILLSIPESRIRVVDRTENILNDIRRQLAEELEDVSLDIRIKPAEKLRFDDSEDDNEGDTNSTSPSDGSSSDSGTSIGSNYLDVLEKQKNLSAKVQEAAESGDLQGAIEEAAEAANGTVTSEVTVSVPPDPEEIYPESAEGGETSTGNEDAAATATWVTATMVGVGVGALVVIAVYGVVVVRKRSKHRTLRVATRYDVTAAPRSSVVGQDDGDTRLISSSERSTSSSNSRGELNSPGSVNRASSSSHTSEKPYRKKKDTKKVSPER
eukprot:gb/GECG01003704.1/.p1 GENE.gb/GECG01003704.1/~~gb/GECG01003704.1/.p1  ORF type:complete len:3814 (+),score=427.70 gb/GECG01003704.1/:1-11442(+)